MGCSVTSLTHWTDEEIELRAEAVVSLVEADDIDSAIRLLASYDDPCDLRTLAGVLAVLVAVERTIPCESEEDDL